MIIRSKAPLRLGLAGGGTDVAPFSDIFGGTVLNATINMFAYASLEPADDGMITINRIGSGKSLTVPSGSILDLDGEFDLVKGVYNRVVRDFSKKPLSFRIWIGADAPPGSGLGTSSTLVVAILGVFAHWLNLPLGEYDLAHLAYEIERLDMKMAGGKQDQYAATFGGVNFMEFRNGDEVIVNPLRIRDEYLDELSHNLILYHTETSRISSVIIEEQQKNVMAGDEQSLEAMHKLKEQSVMMKEALLRGELDQIGEILNFGWKFKRKMAHGISNPLIDEIYEAAIQNGATGGKVSGAGGGGFMFFYCPGNTRYKVTETLDRFGGTTKRYEFTAKGLKTWTI